MRKFFAFALAVSVCLPISLFANVYNVTGNADGAGSVILVGPGGTFNASTLRAAVNAANSTVGPHLISLPAGTFTLTLGELAIGTNGPLNISINGAGSAVTTVQHDLASSIARVFDVDPFLLGGVTVTFNNLTIAHGRNNDGIGGAGLISGFQGPPAIDTTALNNVIFVDNQITGGAGGAVGGAIQNIGGDLFVSGCTFTSNSAGGFSGGAIYYDTHSPSTGTLQVASTLFIGNSAADPANGGGAIFVSGLSGSALSISNSFFGYNKVTSTNGSGGAIIKFGTAPINISGCTFLTNQVFGQSAVVDNASGGAIDNAGGPMTLVYSRFVGNTTTSAGHGDAVNNAVASGASLFGNNNWWASNTGPGTNLSGATPANWLMLNHYANPFSINTNSSTTLTASFLTNSAGTPVGAANLGIMISQPITFANPAKGVLSATQFTITASATATAVFTCGVIPGAASADAIVDGVVATAPINIICPPYSGSIGGGGAVCAGGSSTVSVNVSSGTPPYIVTLNNGGGTKTNASPINFSLSPLVTTSYSVVSVIDSNLCSVTVPGSATITVNTNPVASITPNPSSVCPNSIGNQADGVAGMSTYAWTISNGTITGPTNLASVTYSAGGAGAVTLGLVVVNPNGCSGTNSLIVPTNSFSPPTITATPNPVCAGSSGNQANGPSGMASYAWTISNGVIVGPTNLASINYTAGASGSVGLGLAVVSLAGCSGTNVLNVSIPTPPSIAASPSVVCAGSPGNLAASVGSYSSYAWSISNGTITSATNLQSITYVAGASGSISLTLTITDSGCVTTASTNISITPLPTLSTGCSLRTNYFANLVFIDALPATTMPMAFDGTNYWEVGGGTTTGNRLAQFDANGVLLGTYQPGLDFRSIFTDGKCLLARVYNSPVIYRMVSPGVFTNSGVTLVGGTLNLQASVVMNAAATEYLALGLGAVSRWDNRGNYLGSVALNGYGSLAGESGTQSFRLAVLGEFWLTYNAAGVMSVWDNTGNRLANVVLSAATNSLDAIYSFSACNGKVFTVDVAGGAWRAFDICNERFAIYGTPGDPAWNSDVQAKVLSAGLNLQVDAIFANPVPTLSDLRKYQSVLVYSDSSGFGTNTTNIGNSLADYIDLGGGVDIGTFAFYTSGNLSIQGRLATNGYLPFTTGNQNVGTDLLLVKDLPTHPILAGVNSLDGGLASYHNSPIGIAAGATLVGHWSNSQPLIGTKDFALGRTVGLNFYPPSSDARNDFWLAGTDGGRIMANALLWAGKAPPFISINPASQAAGPGTNVTFSVVASGVGPLTYQWRKDGTNIVGATTNTLTVNCRTNTTGGYRAIVANAYGIAVSTPAVLNSALKFAPLTAPSGGMLPLFLGTADGSALGSDRIAAIRVFSSTNISIAFSNWTQIPNPIIFTNGFLRIDGVVPSGSQYFRAAETY